jgi:hypothetical protein
MFVIDASVALAWCFDDEASRAADAVLERLENEAAVAPAHWPLEVANAPGRPSAAAAWIGPTCPGSGRSWLASLSRLRRSS